MRSALYIATLATNCQRAMRKTVRQREGWKKPPTGKLLINVDGSFREQYGDGGTGVVIRDLDGSSLQALTLTGSMWLMPQWRKQWHWKKDRYLLNTSDAAASSFIQTARRLWTLWKVASHLQWGHQSFMNVSSYGRILEQYLLRSAIGKQIRWRTS